VSHPENRLINKSTYFQDETIMTLIPLVVDDNTNNGEWLKHYLSAILQPMPILFHLYMQLNSDAAHSYQYVGVSSETGRIISINTKQADISESADTLFHEGHSISICPYLMN
jgi:hypothetical protein